jgi:hypothetical protein
MPTDLKGDREALLVSLRALYNGGRYDLERAHQGADEALLMFIDDDEIRAAYERIEKWYA